jgi:hypothetical protein
MRKGKIEPTSVGGLDVGLCGKEVVPGAVDANVVDPVDPRFSFSALGDYVGIFGVVVSFTFNQPVFSLGVDGDEISIVLATFVFNPGRAVGVYAKPPLDLG